MGKPKKSRSGEAGPEPTRRSWRKRNPDPPPEFEDADARHFAQQLRQTARGWSDTQSPWEYIRAHTAQRSPGSACSFDWWLAVVLKIKPDWPKLDLAFAQHEIRRQMALGRLDYLKRRRPADDPVVLELRAEVEKLNREAPAHLAH